MTQATPTQTAAKPARKGFFGRLFDKLDASMKAKAEKKAEEGCCCKSDGKGSKCC